MEEVIKGTGTGMLGMDKGEWWQVANMHTDRSKLVYH